MSKAKDRLKASKRQIYFDYYFGDPCPKCRKPGTHFFPGPSANADDIIWACQPEGAS
jgi:hypothetical protein